MIKQILNIIVLILIFSISLNSKDIIKIKKIGNIYKLIMKNTTNHPIIIQTCTWEIYTLKKSESFLAFPDSSYKINHIILYQASGFKYRTVKSNYLPGLKDIFFKKIKENEFFTVVIKVDTNTNRDINLNILNKASIIIPYAYSEDFHKNLKEKNIDLWYLIDKKSDENKTVTLHIDMDYHVLKLYTADNCKRENNINDIENILNSFNKQFVVDEWISN